MGRRIGERFRSNSQTMSHEKAFGQLGDLYWIPCTEHPRKVVEEFLRVMY